MITLLKGFLQNGFQFIQSLFLEKKKKKITRKHYAFS